MTLIWLGLGLATLALFGSSLHLRSLLRYAFGTQRPLSLDFSPTQLSWPDRGFLVLLLLYKAILSTVGHSSGKLRPSKDAEALFDLPLLELTCPVAVTSSDVQRYRAAANLPQADADQRETISFAFLMASLTNPLMLLLVVHPSFPVAPLGAVNVRNRFEFLQADPAAYQDGQFTASALAGGPDNRGRRTKRGIEFDVVITVQNKETKVVRQIITIMKSLPRRHKPAPPTEQVADSSSASSTVQLKSIGSLSFPTHAPTLWANLCGDFNPIHMSSALARLFGLPGRIAHGNHVVAAFLQLAYEQPSFVNVSSRPWYLEAEFRRPMVLPLTLDAQLDSDETSSNLAWHCKKGEKVYVSGSIGNPK